MSEFAGDDPARRIVVTGMGAVSALGNEVDDAVDALFDGRDAIRPMMSEVTEQFPQLKAYVAAPVSEFAIESDPLLQLNSKELRDLNRGIQFSLWATVKALRQAGLIGDNDAKVPTDMVIGECIGTGVGGAVEAFTYEDQQKLRAGKRLSGSSILKFLADRVATVPSMRFGIRGPVKEVTGACATGNLNITTAADILRLGRAEIMVAGGTEGQITGYGVSLFDGTRGALDDARDPAKASRPFHNDANGFVIGEGSGIVVLQTLESARKCGAQPLAELIGYAETADADHPTMSSGEGVARALRLSLGRLASAQDIALYINAHATGTRGDAVELRAIGDVLDPKQVAGISSTKGATGHMLGAAGAFESIVTIEAVRRGIIPPSLKLDDPVSEAERWNMSVGKATRVPVDAGVNISSGFGGINCVTVWAPYND